MSKNKFAKYRNFTPKSLIPACNINPIIQPWCILVGSCLCWHQV